MWLPVKSPKLVSVFREASRILTINPLHNGPLTLLDLAKRTTLEEKRRFWWRQLGKIRARAVGWGHCSTTFPPHSVHTIKFAKIIVVWARIVWFWFWKQVHETVLVKMTFKSLKSDQKLTNKDPVLVQYFENNANQSAVVKFWFWIKNWNCETILVNGVQIVKIRQKIRG